MKRFSSELVRVSTVLCILLSVALLTFCSSEPAPKPENEIVGSWIELGGTEKMEFFADSTITIFDQGDTLKGHYEVVADTLIRFKVSGKKRALATPVEITGSIIEGKMRFKTPDGQFSEYKKYK